MIGVDFSAGMARRLSQLNAALGSNLQFSNPSGTVLQVLNQGGSSNTVNSLSATTTATSLYERQPAASVVHRWQPADHRCADGERFADHGLAGRIAVNAAVVASPSSLVAYAANTDCRRRDAAEFPAQSDDHGDAKLFADDRVRQREFAL